MASLHEREYQYSGLKLKQYQVDSWTTREQLCLASAVLRSGSGDQNWAAVSRTIKALTSEHDRPVDWYSTKNCALQYAKLLEQIETPKRKREKNEPPLNESPGEIVTKMLSKQRTEELKGILEEEKATYNQLHAEIKLLESNAMDDKINQLWEETMREQELEDEEEERRQIWLKEREEKIKAIQLALKSPTLKGQNVSPQKEASDIGPILEDEKPVVDSLAVQEEKHQKDVEMDDQPSNLTSSNEDSNSKSTIIDSDICSESLSTENQTTPQVSEFNFKKQDDVEEETLPVSTESEKSLNIKIEEDEEEEEEDEDEEEVEKADVPAVAPKVEHNPYLFIDDDSELTSCVYVSEKVSKAKFEKGEFKVDKEKVNKVVSKLESEPEKGTSPLKSASSEIVTEKLFKADEVYTYHEEPEEKQTKRDYTRRRDFHKEDPFKLITEAKQISELENSLKKLEQSKLEAKSNDDLKKSEVADSSSNDTLLNSPGASRVKEESVDGGSTSWLKEEEENFKGDESRSKRKRKYFFQKKDEVKEEIKADEKPVSKLEEEKTELPIKLDSDEKDKKTAADTKFSDTFSNSTSPSASVTHFDVPIKLLPKSEKKEEKFESDNESVRDDECYRGSRTRDEDFEEVSRDSMDLSLRDYSMRSDRRKISASESVSSPRISESTPSSPASTHYGDDIESEKSHRMWKRAIMLLWKDIAAHKNASIFLKPITEDKVPGYHSIVLKPVDLFKIKRHIDNGHIRSLGEFHRDILLMFLNAKMYNAEDHNVHIMASEMLTDTVASLEEHVRAAQTDNAPAETTPKSLRREMRESSAKSDRKRKRDETSGDEKRRK